MVITVEDQNRAEQQIIEEKEPVAFDTREYPVEVLIDKYQTNEFFIPKYQRNFVWGKDKEKMSKFIESIILDLPVPYLFFADDRDTGKLEIVDGSQRIRTLDAFKNNEFELEGLEKLDLLNGFKFSDLPESRQRRFLRKTLRSIELTEKASSDVRRDLFERINTKPYDLLPMELRKGLYDGDFYNFIEECSNNELFTVLCPISEKRKDRGEAQELILRYFAYADNYQAFVHSVEDFIDDYMKSKHENGFDRENMLQQFVSMLNFVNQNFPYGFRKSENSSSIARTGIDGGNETVRTCKSCEKLSKYSGNPAFGLHFGKGSFGRKTVGFIMESIARKNLFSRSPFAAEREKRQNGQQMENYY